jgi:hypothetical protein
MSSAAEQSNFPTMIIPKGTEIKINTQGQLSIKTPGNLVIQNSGAYAELESTNGSIRIEDSCTVEAISVRAAQACFIQGSLTAWKVQAKKIALEDSAKAYIMLQESEQLELSKGSRLVGNFTNEKEIYLLLGKFSAQLKALPGSVDMASPTGMEARAAIAQSQPAPMDASGDAGLPPALQRAAVLLETELHRPNLDAGTVEVLRELAWAIRARELQRVSAVYRDAFSEIGSPSPQLSEAYRLLESVFATR